MQKMKADAAAAQPATKGATAPVNGSARKVEIERLQAALDSATSRQVQQADYEAAPSRKSRADQADYEEDAR